DPGRFRDGIYKIGSGDGLIAERIGTLGGRTPVVLVINKTDLLKDRAQVLGIIDAYRSLAAFVEIVPVSALKRRNTGRLLDVLFAYLPEGPQLYDEDTLTDQPMRQIAAELVREKALRLMEDEVPHGIAVTVEKMKERKGGSPPIMDIEATIICEKDSHKGMIIGKGGAMLQKIGKAARVELEGMLGCKVNLKLWVKVRKEWRDNTLFVRSFGYRE
ncbi:MAG: GTPase Era, partial [Lachnospiraceae bacterium]|nr:GTPase Era [Lachnospiraceae bacterium]